MLMTCWMWDFERVSCTCQHHIYIHTVVDKIKQPSWPRSRKFVTYLRLLVTYLPTYCCCNSCFLVTFRVRHSWGKMYTDHSSLCVCLSLAAFSHYCMDPNVSWGNNRVCPIVVHYWADLQSVHGFHCYDNIAPNAKCQQVLVFRWEWYGLWSGRCKAYREAKENMGKVVEKDCQNWQLHKKAAMDYRKWS